MVEGRHGGRFPGIVFLDDGLQFVTVLSWHDAGEVPHFSWHLAHFPDRSIVQDVGDVSVGLLLGIVFLGIPGFAVGRESPVEHLYESFAVVVVGVEESNGV